MKPTHRPHYKRHGRRRQPPPVTWAERIEEIRASFLVHGGLNRKFVDELHRTWKKKSNRRAAQRSIRRDQQIDDLAKTKPEDPARAKAVAEKIKRLLAEKDAETTWGPSLFYTNFETAPYPTIIREETP